MVKIVVPPPQQQLVVPEHPYIVGPLYMRRGRKWHAMMHRSSSIHDHDGRHDMTRQHRARSLARSLVRSMIPAKT